MSVPPQLIRVKRKATEEAPVSYLRVQETKRHRSGVFVYQRQNQEAAFAETIPSHIQIPKPIIHTSPQDRQATTSQSATKQNAHPLKDTSTEKKRKNGEDNDGEGEGEGEGDSDNAPQASLSGVSAADTNSLDPGSASASEPRRFHMSRKDMLLAASTYPDRPHGVSKKRPAPAMFVERKIKRISSKIVGKFHATSNASAPTAEAMVVDEPEPRKFKKPGVAKLSAARDDKSSGKSELPKSMTDRWNVNLEQLTADMEAYTMQQIGLNLQKAEVEKAEQAKLRNSTPSKLKFKPKPPAQRYADRHPEEVQHPEDKEMADVDVDNSDSDDSDYIIETYVRVPASSIGDHIPPQSVGLLVFDGEPDIEFFYGEDDESEDDWAEDEEDENGMSNSLHYLGHDAIY